MLKDHWPLSGKKLRVKTKVTKSCTNFSDFIFVYFEIVAIVELLKLKLVSFIDI